MIRKSLLLACGMVVLLFTNCVSVSDLVTRGELEKADIICEKKEGKKKAECLVEIAEACETSGLTEKAAKYYQEAADCYIFTLQMYGRAAEIIQKAGTEAEAEGFGKMYKKLLNADILSEIADYYNKKGQEEAGIQAVYKTIDACMKKYIADRAPIKEEKAVVERSETYPLLFLKALAKNGRAYLTKRVFNKIVEANIDSVEFRNSIAAEIDESGPIPPVIERILDEHRIDETIPVLEKIADKKNEYSDSALVYLGQWGIRDSVGLLISQLKNTKYTRLNIRKIADIINKLREIGDKQAIEPIKVFLDDEHKSLDKAYKVRQSAIIALHFLMDKNRRNQSYIESQIMDILSNEDVSKPVFYSLFGYLCYNYINDYTDKKTIDFILSYKDHSDPMIRKNAAMVSRELFLKSPKTLGVLIEQIEDKDEIIQKAAFDELVEYIKKDYSAAVDMFIDLKDKTNIDVRIITQLFLTAGMDMKKYTKLWEKLIK